MARNLATGAELQCAADAQLKSAPLVSDDAVLWSTHALGSSDEHTYCYHLPNGPLDDLGVFHALGQVVNSPEPLSYDEGRFIYFNEHPGDASMRGDLYVYDLATRKSTLITDKACAVTGHTGASLRGSYLAYTKSTGGDDVSGLFLRDLRTGQETKASTGINFACHPCLSDSYLVWTEVTWDDAGNPTYHLYLLDRATNQTRPIPYDAYPMNFSLKVSGSLVVWQSSATLFTHEMIMVYDISSGTTTQLTDDDVSNMAPCTAGGKVYWQSNANGGGLFMAEPASGGSSSGGSSSGGSSSGGSSSGGSSSGHPFVDVPGSHYYVEAIEGLYGMSIVDGHRVVDGKRYYDPDEPVNRAQFAKMITGSLGVPIESVAGAAVFVDLGAPDANGYPDKYVATILDQGVTKGIDATHFGPWLPVKRAQVVTMLVRAANKLRSGLLSAPPANYTGSVPGYASPDHSYNLKVAEYNGLLDHLQGFGANWNPDAAADRAECAQLMWNYIKLVQIRE